MNYLYRIGNNLYVNITNKCACDCIFCIRKIQDGMNINESLWLEQEPTVKQVKEAFQNRNDLNLIEEIVFCGYGEPLERAEEVVELARYFKQVKLPQKPNIRINTNGLVKLINSDFDISRLKILDSVSVSLNADCAEEYVRLTQPRFGEIAYNIMLDFIVEVKKYTKVSLSVVSLLQPDRIEKCKKIADNLGATLKVRNC